MCAGSSTRPAPPYPGAGTDVRVLLDVQAFRQRRGGVSRYFTSLLTEYRADPGLGVEAVTPFRYVDNDYLLDLDPGRYRRTRLALLPAVERARRVRSEIVHHTWYARRFLNVGRGARRITTVHDMIPEVLPAEFGDRNPHLAKREFVAASDAVLCVSDATRRDLLRVYGAPRAAVFVTPLGVSPRFTPAARPPEWAPEEYLLFVGDRWGYKNFPTLVEAVATLGRRHRRLCLVCVGGTPFDATETAALARLGLADRVVRRAVTDAELCGLYAGAVAFVFPSLYEGFGLPILEAFASGCPAVVADTPCFREVADAAALYFPGRDAAALAATLDQVVGDAHLRDTLRRDGLLRARSYTWSRTARQTAEVYRQIL